MDKRRKKLILGFIFTISIIIFFILGSTIDWLLTIIGATNNLYSYIIGVLYIIAFVLSFYGMILLIQNSTIEEIHFTENDIEYSGFWRRVMAAIIDWLIGYLIIPIFMNLYYWFRDGQTIGYKALGIKVYKIDGDKIKSATGIQLFFYPFVKIINIFTFLIGYIMIGFTKRKQGLHNMINSTVVIKTSNITKFPNEINHINKTSNKIEDNVEL